MIEHTAKRPRLSVKEVLLEMDDEETEHIMTVGSDNEFEDICCEERERDEYGSVREHYLTSK